ncbi:MAG TPA: MATE family efflux transporter [Bacteroidales bacterium]|nr:MATE family efflux transporter [Bacteroidales bacterium]
MTTQNSNIKGEEKQNRPRLRSLTADIIEAVSGSEQDFTEGRLSRAIFLLSVPAVLEMIMESIFVVTDIFFVSKLGSPAVATVGLTESMITIVYAISIGLATATTSMVSRRIGEKNSEGASRTAVQAILTGITISLIIGIPGAIFSKNLLHAMGASPEIISQMSGYTTIMLAGNTVIMLLFIINAVFRSAGDAAVAMRVLWAGNIINIILDPCLIFGLGPFPEFGIKGAAIATTTGRGIAVLYQFYLLFLGRKRIQISRKQIGIDLKVISRLIKLSLGSIGQNLIGTSSWIALVRIISEFGSGIVAGYTIAIRIVSFTLLPSWGISNAASTLVGQNLGARKPERAERAVIITGLVNMALLGSIGILLVCFPAPFIRLFIHEPVVVNSGIECLRIVSIGFISYGLGMTLVNSFNGAGDTATPLRINVFAFWMLEIPLAYILSLKTGMHEKGVFAAIVIAETVMTIIAWIVFRKGKWKMKEV